MPLLSAGLTLSAAPVVAQVSAPAFTVAMGLANPLGTFRSGFREEGFGPSVGLLTALSVGVRGTPVRVRVDASFSSHGANDQLKSSLQAAFGQPGNQSLRLLGGNLDLVVRAPFGSKVQPYLLGGVGISNSSAQVTTGQLEVRNSETGFAWNAGAGTSIRAGGVALVIEARLISAASPAGLPRTTVMPIMVGLEFGGRRPPAQVGGRISSR